MKTLEELCQTYYDQENTIISTWFQHSLDIHSSRALYSLLRHFKPDTILEIGAFIGGATEIIVQALEQNKKPYNFISSEKDPDRRDGAIRHVQKSTGIQVNVIGDITENVSVLPKNLDFVFVDNDHDLGTTEWIAENIWPKIPQGKVMGMHDWPVQIIKGKHITKEDLKIGNVWDETKYIIKRIKNNTFPFTPMYYMYKGQGSPETGFWIKK